MLELAVVQRYRLLWSYLVGLKIGGVLPVFLHYVNVSLYYYITSPCRDTDFKCLMESRLSVEVNKIILRTMYADTICLYFV